MLYIQFSKNDSSKPGDFSWCTSSDIEKAGKKGCLPIASQYTKGSSSFMGCVNNNGNKGELVIDDVGIWRVSGSTASCPTPSSSGFNPPPPADNNIYAWCKK